MIMLKNHQFDQHATKYRSLYINRFMGMKCASDLLIRNLFPNAKEITESFGAFQALANLDIEFTDNVTVFCVGDGRRPRTAATFAFRSPWETHSIDPDLKVLDYDMKRVTLHKKRIEDCDFECERALIVCVHSHAKLSECLNHIKADRRDLISIPCCTKNDVFDPDVTYNDQNIWSEKNLVEVWRDI